MTQMIPAWVDGALTPVEKLSVHQQGLRHMAVSVFVLRGDEMLIQQRAMGKYHTPGLWANACCTHPAWNEEAADCAQRRLEEELGITGQSPEFRQRVEYRAAVGNGLTEHEVVDIFVVHATPDMDVRPNPDEVMALRWVSFDELARDVKDTPARFTPWLHIYLKSHSEAIFGRNVIPAQ